jgi:hypothetical protein
MVAQPSPQPSRNHQVFSFPQLSATIPQPLKNKGCNHAQPCATTHRPISRNHRNQCLRARLTVADGEAHLMQAVISSSNPPPVDIHFRRGVLMILIATTWRRLCLLALRRFSIAGQTTFVSSLLPIGSNVGSNGLSTDDNRVQHNGFGCYGHRFANSVLLDRPGARRARRNPRCPAKRLHSRACDSWEGVGGGTNWASELLRLLASLDRAPWKSLGFSFHGMPLRDSCGGR